MTTCNGDRTAHDCGDCHACEAKFELPDDAPQGVWLVAGALTLFLLPLLLAVVGAWMLPATGDSQTLGAMAGLGAGMLIAGVVGHLWQAREVH